MRTLSRSLPLVLVLAACSGTSNPPPPVATATPAATSANDAVQPMSSRDGGPAPTGRGAVDPNAPLPPGHPPLGGSDPHGAAGGTGKSAGTITGTIALSSKLSTGASDVLYVMAKKGTSTLAVKRVEKPKFPLDFEISSADSMVAGADFVGPVDVVARLSKTGDAIPAKGDLEGLAKGVKIPATGVKLTIDTVRQ